MAESSEGRRGQSARGGAVAGNERRGGARLDRAGRSVGVRVSGEGRGGD